MGQALYRKYRSKTLAEVLGQEHITATLQNALKSGAISHAYLFTGPRGTGKTSTARILAYEVNQLPYQEDTTHLDIIEIDAASNRRIDEIRELRDRVHTAPASSKYKVYIIDEVHMLTREAFNALLKTLEEPPAHAIFILATTEAHKLPETIISRTQRFTFKPIDTEKVKAHLRFIADQEKTVIDDAALELIAEHGGGSFRDSISLLDQIRHLSDHITLDHVRQTLGIAPRAVIEELLAVIEAGQLPKLVTLLDKLKEQGYQAPQLAKQLAVSLRQSLVSKTLSMQPAVAIQLLEKLIEVPASHDPEVLFEVILIDSASHTAQIQPAVPAQAPNPVARPAADKKPKPKAASTPKSPKAEEQPVPSKSSPAESAPAENSQAKNGNTPLNEQAWQNALAAIKQKHNTLYSVARMARPSFDGNSLTLSFSFAFHQKRLNDVKNKQVLSRILVEQTGLPVTIDCVLDENPDNQQVAASTVRPINAISNIFGEAEVLE